MDEQYKNQHMVEVPMEQGDFIIWNNNLPHNGGANTLKNHWRLHAYVRYLPLEGSCTCPSLVHQHKQYQKMVKRCMRTGEKPSHFATLNPVRANAQSFQLEVDYHNSPPLSLLEKKLFGNIEW